MHGCFSACLSVHCVSLQEGIRSPGTGFRMVANDYLGLVIEPRPSGRASALNP